MEPNFIKIRLPDGRALGELKVKDLKVELEKRRLSKSGNKDDLFRRLGTHITSMDDSQSKDSSGHREMSDDEPEGEESMNHTRSRSESPVNNIDDEMSSRHSEASDVQSKESIHSMEENDKGREKTDTEMDEPEPIEHEAEETSGGTAFDLEFDESEDFAAKEISHSSPDKSNQPEKQEEEVKSLEEGEVETMADESNNLNDDSKTSLKRSNNTSQVDADEEEPAKRIRTSLTHPQTILKITVEKDSPESAAIKAKRKGPKDTVVVGYMLEKPARLEPSQPVSTQVSNIISIRHLVRPFTDKQLRQILQEYGTVSDLWLDKIKSKAYAVFQMEEDAKKCRDELDGCRWPSINTKALRTDYATQDEFNWMVQHGDSGQTMPRNLRGLTGVSRNNVSHKTDSLTSKLTGGLIITVSEDDRDRKYSSKDNNLTVYHPESDEAASSIRKRKLDEEEERKRHLSREHVKEKERKSPRDRERKSSRERERKSSLERERRSSLERERRSSLDKELTERRAHEKSSSNRRSRSRERIKEKTRSHQLTDLFRKTSATPALFWKLADESVIKSRRAEQSEANRSSSKPSDRKAAEHTSKQRGDPQRR